MSRAHIAEAIRADAQLDLVLARYAEHGHAEDLAVAQTLNQRVSDALAKESNRKEENHMHSKKKKGGKGKPC
jgi:hypothetical protein